MSNNFDINALVSLLWAILFVAVGFLISYFWFAQKLRKLANQIKEVFDDEGRKALTEAKDQRLQILTELQAIRVQLGKSGKS